MDASDFPINYPLQDEQKPLSDDSITFESIMKSHRKIENILNQNQTPLRQMETGRILEYLLNGKKIEAVSNSDEKDPDHKHNKIQKRLRRINDYV